jgi:hypothetical protein
MIRWTLAGAKAIVLDRSMQRRKVQIMSHETQGREQVLRRVKSAPISRGCLSEMYLALQTQFPKRPRYCQSQVSTFQGISTEAVPGLWPFDMRRSHLRQKVQQVEHISADRPVVYTSVPSCALHAILVFQQHPPKRPPTQLLNLQANYPHTKWK